MSDTQTEFIPKPSSSSVSVSLDLDESTAANKRLYSEAFDIIPTDTRTVVTYTIPAGKKFYIKAAHASTNGNMVVSLMVNSSKITTRRSSYMDRNLDLYAPLRLDAGDILSVTAKNVSFQNQNNDVTVDIYAREFDI